VNWRPWSGRTRRIRRPSSLPRPKYVRINRTLTCPETARIVSTDSEDGTLAHPIIPEHVTNSSVCCGKPWKTERRTFSRLDFLLRRRVFHGEADARDWDRLLCSIGGSTPRHANGTWFPSSSRSRPPHPEQSGIVGTRAMSRAGRLADCLAVDPLDRPRRPGVPFGPFPLPVMIDGGGPMGSARDSSPEASQASGAARLPLPAPVWRRPVSSSEPRVSSGSRGGSPTSHHALPASMPPSMASPPSGGYPEACHLPHGPALLRHPSPGIGLRPPCRAGASRPQGHQNDEDLPARAHSRRGAGPQSSGCLVAIARR